MWGLLGGISCFVGVVIILQSLWALITGGQVEIWFYNTSELKDWDEAIKDGFLSIAIGAGLMYAQYDEEKSKKKKW